VDLHPGLMVGDTFPNPSSKFQAEYSDYNPNIRPVMEEINPDPSFYVEIVCRSASQILQPNEGQ
jgi:hypothetical protein